MRKWTQPGITAMWDRHSELQQKMNGDRIALMGDCRANSTNEAERDVLNETLRQNSLTALDVSRAAMLLADTQPLPEPRQFRRVQAGHLVRYVCVDTRDAKPEQAFVLGGEDEPDAYPTLATYSYTAPFGKAFIGKEVGDELDVVLFGVQCRIEITGIENPATTLATEKSPKAKAA
ncbi:MAG: hypothetical protein JWN64_154 [Parcubacteria group bacterium]|nr:hypothetical protein [Parcubacteria group bacterium]